MVVGNGAVVVTVGSVDTMTPPFPVIAMSAQFQSSSCGPIPSPLTPFSVPFIYLKSKLNFRKTQNGA